MSSQAEFRLGSRSFVVHASERGFLGLFGWVCHFLAEYNSNSNSDPCKKGSAGTGSDQGGGGKDEYKCGGAAVQREHGWKAGRQRRNGGEAGQW